MSLKELKRSVAFHTSILTQAADALSGLLEVRQLVASSSHRQLDYMLEVCVCALKSGRAQQIYEMCLVNELTCLWYVRVLPRSEQI